MSDRDALLALLAERSLRSGQFTLASGRKSDTYIDARLTTMSPEGLALIGSVGLGALRAHGWAPDSIGGLTLGADPVAYAISCASVGAPPMIRAFTVRKESKEHGTKKLIEGPFRAGDAVVIVEDVITSGASALRAIDAVRDAGAVVLGVLAVVDRQEGGADALQAAGADVLSIATLADLRARAVTK